MGAARPGGRQGVTTGPGVPAGKVHLGRTRAPHQLFCANIYLKPKALALLKSNIITLSSHMVLFNFFLKNFCKTLFIFRQRGREEGREGEKHQCAAASRTPPAGALRGHQTGEPLARRPALNPLSHPSQGSIPFKMGD